jgi:hypothetical protein
MITYPILSFTVFGQDHIVGLKGGMNLTNVNSSNFISNTDNQTGFSGGVTYEYRLSSKFNFGMDLLYVQKGFTSDIIFIDQTGIPTGEKATLVFNYNYLSLPVKAGFTVGDQISGFVNLGLVPSILTDARITDPAIEGIRDKATYDVTDQVTGFDFGGLAEVGGSYRFNKRFLLLTSFGYQQSFTSITNEHYYKNGKARHYGMALSIGLKYALKK